MIVEWEGIADVYHWYDIKKFDGEILELWGLWSTSSLPSLLGPLWLGVVTPDKVLYMGQIEVFDI